MTNVLLSYHCLRLRTGFRQLWQHRRFFAKTHYEVLGVSRTATQDEIKTAYINLSKQLHPDLNKSDPKYNEKFVRVNEAYNVLSKPSSRREYDSTFGPQNPYRTSHAYTTERRIFEQQFGYKPPHKRQWEKTASGPGLHGYDSETGKREFYDETIQPQRPFQYNSKRLLKIFLYLISFVVILDFTRMHFYMKTYRKNIEAIEANNRRILQEYEASTRYNRENPEVLKEKLLKLAEDGKKTGKS